MLQLLPRKAKYIPYSKRVFCSKLSSIQIACVFLLLQRARCRVTQLLYQLLYIYKTCRSVFNVLMFKFYKFYIFAVVGIIIE